MSNVRMDKNCQSVINLDRILTEEVGLFGNFQLRVIALCAVVGLFSGLHYQIFIFTFAPVKTRCLIQECEGSSSVNFTPPWLPDAVPTVNGSFDNCHRFAPISDNDSDNRCSADLFERNSAVKCTEYVYEHENSAVFDYNLACDNWRPNLAGSVIAFGNILGCPVGGLIADQWGRRAAVALSAFNLAWIGATLYFADTFISYVLIGFVSTCFGASCYDNTCILGVEYAGSKHRVAVVAALSTFAALGRVIMGMITWTEPYWRNLIFIVHAPPLITVLYFWIVPESIRWLMSKNRHDDAVAILKKAAAINGNALSKETLRRFDNAEHVGVKGKDAHEPWLIYLVFKHKTMLLRCTVTPMWWITIIFVISGLSMSAVSISGNRFVNYTLVAGVSIPGYWTSVLLLDRIGRKPLLMAAIWICGVCQFAYIFVYKDNYGLSLAMYLVSKLCTAVALTTLSVYTAELYPTRYRASLFAFSSTIGSFGAVFAPLITSLAAETWNNLPFAVYGGMAFFSGILVLLTPETLGTTLPDTMAEAARLGEKTTNARVLQPFIQRRLVT